MAQNISVLEWLFCAHLQRYLVKEKLTVVTGCWCGRFDGSACPYNYLGIFDRHVPTIICVYLINMCQQLFAYIWSTYAYNNLRIFDQHVPTIIGLVGKVIKLKCGKYLIHPTILNNRLQCRKCVIWQQFIKHTIFFSP